MLLLLLAVAASAGCSDDGPQDELTLALDFQPNPAHAGIYGALREGSNLEVRVPSSSTDSLKLLGAVAAAIAYFRLYITPGAKEPGGMGPVG